LVAVKSLTALVSAPGSNQRKEVPLKRGEGFSKIDYNNMFFHIHPSNMIIVAE